MVFNLEMYQHLKEQIQGGGLRMNERLLHIGKYRQLWAVWVNVL